VMSVIGHGVDICTSLTRPTPFEGLIAYETDTNRLIIYTNGSWNNLALSNISFNNQTASYTLVLNDMFKLVEISSGSATTLTVPNDGSVNFPVGSQITVLQTNTGQITFAGAGGVTVNGTPGLKLRTQWSSATLIKRNANVWVVIGDLVA
jgi:hypothetical protein